MAPRNDAGPARHDASRRTHMNLKSPALAEAESVALLTPATVSVSP